MFLPHLRDHLASSSRPKPVSTIDNPPNIRHFYCEEMPTLPQSQRSFPSPSNTPSTLPLSQKNNLPSELLNSPSPPPVDHSASAEPEIAQLVWVRISKGGEIDEDGDLWWPAQVSLRRRKNHANSFSYDHRWLDSQLMIPHYFYFYFFQLGDRFKSRP